MPGMNLTRAEARERAQLIDVDSYEVELDLTRGEKVFGTTTAVKFTAAPGSSTFIDAVTDSVQSVTLNGRELDPAEVSDGVRIQLPELEAVNELLVVAEAPYMNTGEGLHRFVDPVDHEVYLYTQFEVPDSRRMFAVFEQPDLKATFTFTVIAPSHWDVISNSPTPVPVETIPGTDGGARSVWEFAPTPRLSSYVTALIAGPYQSVRSEVVSADGKVTPLGVFARKSLMQYLDADNIFELTRQGFEFFEAQFGCPYPFEKYDQLFVPEFNAGAMENAGAVTILEGYVFRSKVTDAQVERRAITVLHELAHMWFGDLVTMRWWNDLWLNESFAEYMSHLAAVENTRFDHAWTTFASVEKSWAYRQDQLPTTHPIFAEINDLEDVEVNFDGITYAKGASVLKQLVAYVGFDAFIDGSRRYFKDHQFGNTTLADLLAALSAASGRDLADWARQWLQTSGISTLTAGIEEHDGVLGTVTLHQDAVDPTTGRQEPRPHRLRIGLYDLDAAGALVRTGSVETDVTGARTEVAGLAGRPRPALLLVNDEDLSYAKVRLDPQSEATARSSLGALTDPMARALCWTALWDSARDAATPASLYIDAVQRFGPAESGIGVLLAVLGNASTAIERYVPAAARPAVRRGFLSFAADQLQRAVPGSDQQLAWARTVAAASRYDSSRLDLLRGILDGSTVIEGLSVDAELRWAFWHALAANGDATAEQLDAELAQDNTAAGKAGHATALAARPDAGVKEAAWQEAVHGTSLSNQLLSATIAGFNTAPASQLQGFVDPYFECLEEVWAGRSIEIASRIVRGLYPAGQDLDGQDPDTHPVIVQTDHWLAAHPEAPRALRRIIIEQRSHLHRALTAQSSN